jgi:thiamine-phosphate pyrophosphorylase
MQRECGAALALHLRLRGFTGRDFYSLAQEASRRAREVGGWCVVNGRVDVALAARAQAVQLGQGALPVPAVRTLLPEEMVLGASVHGLAEASLRVQEGADYLLLGTIFPSPSHPGGRAGGPELIRRCRRVGRPLIVIGGIVAERVPEVLAAGAVGVAVIRAVWSARDPVGAALGLAETLAAVEE